MNHHCSSVAVFSLQDCGTRSAWNKWTDLAVQTSKLRSAVLSLRSGFNKWCEYTVESIQSMQQLVSEFVMHHICYKREGIFYCSHCGSWTPQLDEKSLTKTFASWNEIACRNPTFISDERGDEYTFHDLHEVDRRKLIPLKYIDLNMRSIWLKEVQRHCRNKGF